jgi:hypothetical protein
MADEKTEDPTNAAAPKKDEAAVAPPPATRSCQHTQKELDEALKEYLKNHPQKGK